MANFNKTCATVASYFAHLIKYPNAINEQHCRNNYIRCRRYKILLRGDYCPGKRSFYSTKQLHLLRREE